ncbi:hypothetical protein BC829DRAFT_420725 [Chytridium lagenaria]|nr:hypothetical protein BC829DRAFT_420725 [Chytridium lagenaria]
MSEDDEDEVMAVAIASEDDEDEVIAVAIALAEEDELLIMEQRRSRSLIQRRRFNFSKHPATASYWRDMFRFGKNEILQMVHLFGIPNPLVVDRIPVKAEVALCMFLRRMAYPNRLCDLQREAHFWKAPAHGGRHSRQGSSC